MEAYLVRIPPGARTGRPFGLGGEILFICKKGLIDVWVRNKREVLRESDTLHLKATVPYRFENQGAAEAELLAIWSPS